PLHFDPSKASLEVTIPEAFVQDVASETRESAERRGLLVHVSIFPPFCCLIPENQLASFTEFSLNRAIIYSAKLLSFYFRQHRTTALYNAVWRPGTSGEIQVYGWKYTDYRKKYDELWSQGWRLYILQAYVLNGQVLYNAVWRPGTSGEIQ